MPTAVFSQAVVFDLSAQLPMAINPVKYRMMFIPAMLEKAGFGVAAIGLSLTRVGVPNLIVLGGVVDLVFVVLFAFAWWECVRLHGNELN